MIDKLTTAQVEAELKKIDERLRATNRFKLHKGLFVYITVEMGKLYCFWKMSLKHRAEQVQFIDKKLCELSDKILKVMDRWDGVLE